MLCPKCGKELPDFARFCSGCGASLAETAPAAEAAPVEEPAPVVNDSPVEDPAPVVNDSPVEDPVSVVNDSPVEDPVSVAESTPVEETAPVAESAPAEKPASSKKKFPLLFPLIGIAAVLLVVCGVLFFGRGSSPAYVYLTDDSELMFLKDLNAKTAATELSDDASSTNVRFSHDGKYIYFTEVKDSGSSVGTLYRMELSQIGKKGVRPEKIDSDVRTYYVYPLSNGDLLYLKEKSGKQQARIYTGENSYKLVDGLRYWGGFNDSQTFGYYTETDDMGATSLYRIELKEGSKEELLLKHASNIYTDYSADLLVYGVKDSGTAGYSSTQTVYSIKPGGTKEKLADDVVNVMGLTVDNGKVSFYYTVADEEDLPLDSFVTDSFAAADAASTLTEPVYPDWDDYRAWRGLYTGENGQYYYESKSGIVYYLDHASYPGMDNVSIAYAMADDLYAEAVAKYEQSYEQWYAVSNRNNIRDTLQLETYSLTSYTLHHYSDGTDTEIASRLQNSYVSGSGENGIFFYTKYPALDTTVADVSELSSAYDMYIYLNELVYSDSAYYQNVGATESEFDLAGKEYCGVDGIYQVGDNSYILSVYEDDETRLEYFRVENNALVQQETLADENFSVAGTENGTFYYYTDIDSEEAEGDLYRFENGKSSLIADEINACISVAGGKTMYILTDIDYDKKTGYQVAEFSLLTKDGKAVKIGDEVNRWSIWCLDETQVMYLDDGDLYYWNGKESRRIASDVVSFWSNSLVSQRTFYI